MSLADKLPCILVYVHSRCISFCGDMSDSGPQQGTSAPVIVAGDDVTGKTKRKRGREGEKKGKEEVMDRKKGGMDK